MRITIEFQVYFAACWTFLQATVGVQEKTIKLYKLETKFSAPMVKANEGSVSRLTLTSGLSIPIYA